MTLSKIGSGLLLLLIGLAPIGLIFAFENSRNYTPVDVPAPVRPNTVRASFKLNYPGEYVIDYRVRRSLPYQELSCLLSIEDIYPNRCHGRQPPVSTSWTLYKNGKLAARGSTNKWAFDESSATDLSAGIGSFTAGSYRADQYDLTVTLRSNLARLGPLRPRLIVEIHPLSAERFLIPELVAFLLGAMIAIFGLWRLFAGGIAFVRDRIQTRIHYPDKN